MHCWSVLVSLWSLNNPCSLDSSQIPLGVLVQGMSYKWGLLSLYDSVRDPLDNNMDLDWILTGPNDNKWVTMEYASSLARYRNLTRHGSPEPLHVPSRHTYSWVIDWVELTKKIGASRGVWGLCGVHLGKFLLHVFSSLISMVLDYAMVFIFMTVVICLYFVN